MKVLILGAGVIGVTSAYFLRRAGHEVTVLERQPAAALETSFANGAKRGRSDLFLGNVRDHGNRLCDAAICSKSLDAAILSAADPFPLPFHPAGQACVLMRNATEARRKVSSWGPTHTQCATTQRGYRVGSCEARK